jgi:ribosomal-protein-alanine N-acetyltransferase
MSYNRFVYLTSVQLAAVAFLEIKPASTEDLPAIVTLDRLCWGKFWSRSGYQQELESPASDFLVLTPTSPQVSSPGVVGMGCLWSVAEEAHVILLAVHPQYRRMGGGQVLLYGLLLAAHQRGLQWATLEVRSSNRAAIALYQKFGFEILGRRRRYYEDGEDALVLWRPGLQAENFKEDLTIWQKLVSDRALSCQLGPNDSK